MQQININFIFGIPFNDHLFLLEHQAILRRDLDIAKEGLEEIVKEHGGPSTFIPYFSGGEKA